MNNQIQPLKFRFEVILLLFITVTAVILQGPYLFEFPGFIHGWAQADRYALSLGFLRNGFDLFHPETFVYNHIYPHDLAVQGTSTITAVDFPMHDFIAAVFMKLLGTNNPLVFRIYVQFMGVLGLVFLGKLARLILKDDIKALFVVVFASISPVFVYYQGTLLPTVPSLSLVIIGLYYYVRFRESKRESNFHFAIILLGIALLTRTTYVIPFIAVISVEFFALIKTREWSWTRMGTVMLVVVVFLFYRFYNEALAEEYGSMFLNRLMPPASIDQALDLLLYVWKHWRFVYFSSIHYWAVFIIVCFIFYFQIKGEHKAVFPNFLLLLLTLYLSGCVLFAIAMLKQFQDHDYYFLDTFFVPFILGLIVLLAYVPAPRTSNARKYYLVLIVFFVAMAFRMPQRSQRNRYEVKGDDRLQNTIHDFENADAFLNTLHVPQNAVMLVMNAAAPNTALTLMNRKGMVVMNMEEGVLENSFSWEFQYVVFQVDYFEKYFASDYPLWAQRLELVGTNGRISVYQMLH